MSCHESVGHVLRQDYETMWVLSIPLLKYIQKKLFIILVKVGTGTGSSVVGFSK